MLFAIKTYFCCCCFYWDICSCFTFKQMSFVSCYLVLKVVVFYRYSCILFAVVAAAVHVADIIVVIVGLFINNIY